jgi:hypothetical protein
MCKVNQFDKYWGKVNQILVKEVIWTYAKLRGSKVNFILSLIYLVLINPVRGSTNHYSTSISWRA